MRITAYSLTTIIALAALQSPLAAEEESASETVAEQQEPFSSFTGRVTRNKVRMRLQPNLDCPIINQMDRDQMLMVVDEDEDFYAVKPPEQLKGYIYRTYVLDGEVEGNRVNVRLEPTLDAPIIGQLQKGDKVEGEIAEQNSKWLAIEPPATTKFYVCKDFVEKMGDPGLMARIEQRRLEVNGLLNASYHLSRSELEKPFEFIQLEKAYEGFNRIIDEYHDFPDQVARAKELLSETQEAYLQRKIAYLENKTQNVANNGSEDYEEHLLPEESGDAQLGLDASPTTNDTIAYHEHYQDSPFTQSADTYGWDHTHSPLEGASGSWMATENALYDSWSQEHNGSMGAFYKEQRDNAVTLRGVIEPYNRMVKNKPGDYVLMSQSTRLPIAYLYSTQVDLHNRVGNVVTIKAAERDNHNFAFPAYFVLEAE